MRAAFSNKYLNRKFKVSTKSMYKIQVAGVNLSNLISKFKFINTNPISIHLFPVITSMHYTGMAFASSGMLRLVSARLNWICSNIERKKWENRRDGRKNIRGRTERRKAAVHEQIGYGWFWGANRPRVGREYGNEINDKLSLQKTPIFETLIRYNPHRGQHTYSQ